jgi:hypothetical protein
MKESASKRPLASGLVGVDRNLGVRVVVVVLAGLLVVVVQEAHLLGLIHATLTARAAAAALPEGEELGDDKAEEGDNYKGKGWAV